MIIRILSLVFLSIVLLRFPSDKSIANVIQSLYNDVIVKQIRRFEKLDFKIWKNEANSDFFNPINRTILYQSFLISKPLIAVFVFQGRLNNVNYIY